ncbi:hypothetical protein appser10_5180 [Actinobacillus pleuropneumoniae serovar 10 str. D13039]|nr:hypothetical protein appser10_5180 [Actinobacillus pleuropneumoniae serovar 10 str. D13039]
MTEVNDGRCLISFCTIFLLFVINKTSGIILQKFYKIRPLVFKDLMLFA